MGSSQIDDSQSVNASAYHTEVDDLIAFEGENFRAINVREARIDGLEAGYDWNTAYWRLGAALTLQDTEDKSTGQSLLRRADEKLAVSLDRLIVRNAPWARRVSPPPAPGARPAR